MVYVSESGCGNKHYRALQTVQRKRDLVFGDPIVLQCQVIGDTGKMIFLRTMIRNRIDPLVQLRIQFSHYLMIIQRSFK